MAPGPDLAPFWRVALLGRCPRCGSGPLFSGLLAMRESCPGCGLDLRPFEAGDGPAVAGIFLVGAVTVVAALIVDVRYAPPLWVHALVWPGVILVLAILVMRGAKAALAGLQYRQRGGA
ncbi:DUF983 domain-containing protein [Paeniroseomonas aquatica]|uniref:DUF983 domain-containing protein n=2 Tax=Paeniroseomonas aquatica TaxID=373043 RepID=A0ABT8AAG2_9PROT|nr:DUF983 domain-containing protein [Paeniroseomonas aquatica]MDN3566751.1 DUF983 domain-containing protein [Paeniroseomonas aquatica]